MIRYTIFSSFKNIIAFSTDKSDGFGDNPRFTGDIPKVYTENRKILANLVGIMPTQLVFPRQTHSSHVAVIGKMPSVELKDTDALITDKPGICLCIQTADCVPVLLFDPLKRVACIVHAGWRGTLSFAAKKSVEKMISHFGTNPKNIVSAIGPAIGPDVYEVGPDVVSGFHESFHGHPEIIRILNNGKSLLDLWEANRRILIESGLSPSNIEVSRRCSYLENESFYSARREGIHTGRMVSGIFIIPEN